MDRSNGVLPFRSPFSFLVSVQPLPCSITVKTTLIHEVLIGYFPDREYSHGVLRLLQWSDPLIQTRLPELFSPAPVRVIVGNGRVWMIANEAEYRSHDKEQARSCWFICLHDAVRWSGIGGLFCFHPFTSGGSIVWQGHRAIEF